MKPEDDPFAPVRIIAPENDDLTAKKAVADAHTAQNDAVIYSFEEKSQQKLSRIAKLGNLTVALIIVLILLIVGFGAWLIAQSVANNQQNQTLNNSLNQMQKRTGE